MQFPFLGISDKSLMFRLKLYNKGYFDCQGYIIHNSQIKLNNNGYLWKESPQRK
jgi:hypothetical protein